MQGSKVRIHPINDWDDQSQLIVPTPATSTTSIPSSNDNKRTLLEQGNEARIVMSRPKSAENLQAFRPRSATQGTRKSSGEIHRSLAELNPGRRINENMAPYERFLKEAEREIARDMAASKESLNATGKRSVIESKATEGEEIEMVAKRSDQMENSSLEPNYQVMESGTKTNHHSIAKNLDLESDETKQPAEEDERSIRESSWSLSLPVSGVQKPSPDVRGQVLSKSLWPKGNKDYCWVASENPACSIVDEVSSNRPKSGDKSRSNEKLHKTPEREATHSAASLRSEKFIPVRTEMNADKRINVKTMEEEKSIYGQTDNGQNSREFRNHVGQREFDSTKKQGIYLNETRSNLTYSENTDIRSRQPNQLQGTAFLANHAFQSNNSAPQYKPDFKKSPDKILLDYFGRLTTSDDFDDTLDFDFIQSILSIGACVNVMDEYGQTILHEVSRAWSLDAAQFFVKQGTTFIFSSYYKVLPFVSRGCGKWVGLKNSTKLWKLT